MSDSINFQAINAYNKVLNNDVKVSKQNPAIQSANQFHKIFETNFKKYSGLSPEQILSKINAHKSENTGSAFSVNISNAAKNSLSDLRKILSQQEENVQKTAIGQANFVDLMSTTVQAREMLKSAVAIRDEISKSLEKIMNMHI